MKLEKPTKPYSSLKDAALVLVKYTVHDPEGKFNFVNQFPCANCCGRGYNKEYIGIGNDYEKQDCGYCDCGIISKEKFKQWYDAQIAMYKRRLDTYTKDKALLNSAVKKLTEEEYRVIKKYE